MSTLAQPSPNSLRSKTPILHAAAASAIDGFSETHFGSNQEQSFPRPSTKSSTAKPPPKPSPTPASASSFLRNTSQRGTGPTLEAFVAKPFATVSVAKAAYAELQKAQFPYDADAIQAADDAVVREMKLLSELKHSFLKKKIDSSPPHVTILLAEIQEQQSLMKMVTNKGKIRRRFQEKIEVEGASGVMRESVIA